MIVCSRHSYCQIPRGVLVTLPALQPMLPKNPKGLNGSIMACQATPGDRVVKCFRPSPGVGALCRSIRMTPHASGWFDRLRGADCDGATQEATTAGALRGHGQGAPRISRIATDVRGRLRRVLSVPIRVIRGQNKGGSNQPLEPTETRGAVLETAALAPRFSSGLRGSADRSVL